jgi:uracil-DNA glycosylase
MSNPKGIEGTLQALPALSSRPAANRKRKTPMANASPSLKALREEASHCRACPLWKNATQTVFGEGPQHRR